MEWFFGQYGHRIHQPTVSEILSSQWDHLDTVARDELLERPIKRERRPQWPELEDALDKWVQRVEDKISICIIW